MALQEQSTNGSSATSFSTTQLIDIRTMKNSKPEAEAYAKKLLEQGGAELVQKMLKEALNEGRSLDKEVLAEKRKTEAEQKKLDESIAQTTVLDRQKQELYNACKTLLDRNERIEELLGRLETSNPELEHLSKVRDNFKKETDSISEKTDKQRVETEGLVEKNKKLREEFEAKKKEFDDAVQAKIATWKGGEADAVKKLQEASVKTEKQQYMQERLSRDQELLSNLQKAVEQLALAETSYAEKNAEFVRLIDQSKEAIDLYGKNAEIRTKNVATLQEQKKSMQEEHKEKAAAIYKLKNGGLKELKNKVSRLEKEKQAVSAKSRQVVEAANKKQ